MHLGVLATSWPHESDTTAGSFVYALTRALVARGHRATVLFARHPTARPIACDRCELVSVGYTRSSEGLFYDGGAPRALARSPLRSSALAVTYTTRALVAARSALAPCDALVSHFAVPSAVIAALVRGSRPHHAIVHGTDALVLRRSPSIVQQLIARGASSLQFAHPALREALDPALATHGRSTDLPMATHKVDQAQRAAWRLGKRGELGLDEREVLIVCVGRIAREKGCETLVRAARSLDPSRCRVVFVGDGPERVALERIAPPCVRFVGAADSHERDGWLAAADVFAMASWRDSAPAAIVEALAFELPIVATRVGGIPWLVDDAAVLVAPRNETTLARALGMFVDDDALRRSFASRAAVRSRSLPTWDSLADHILQSVGATQ